MLTTDEQKFLEYRRALQSVWLAVAILRKTDFELLIAAIDKADTLGPLIDPTLYCEKHRLMAEDRELFVAAQNFVAKLPRHEALRSTMEEIDV